MLTAVVTLPLLLQVLVAVAVLPLLCDPKVTWTPWTPCTHSCEAGLQSRRITACSHTGDTCQVRYRRVSHNNVVTLLFYFTFSWPKLI